MSLNKEALSDLDGVTVPADEAQNYMMSADDLLYVEEEKESDVKEEEKPAISVEYEEAAPETVFLLPLLPGAEDQSEIAEPSVIEVEEPEEVEIIHDPWKWSVPQFMVWLKDKLVNCPRHSGKDVSGLERAISYLKYLDGECSKATRADIKGELDVNAVEDARDEIYNGIKRLEERLDHVSSSKYNKGKKKKAEEEFETQLIAHGRAATEALTKEAQKASNFQVNVPLFISIIARTCINSTVSAGHDMEVCFKKLAEKFKLDDREKLQVVQLLDDMGYPIIKDRGYFVDEKIDPTSSDNFDFSAQYPA